MGSAIRDLRFTTEVKLGHTPSFPVGENGFVVEGELWHISPLSISFWNINFTSFPGKCSAVLYSLMFWLSKWGHRVFKVEDSMEVSPLHPQYYQLTMQQKQTLERQIKEGLAGISTSITDFELLFHDLRRYQDFINYFRSRELALKTKDNALLMKTEQTLKSVFIDQVDVHTGEGISLKHIAPRWPTIIADFMQMKDEDTNPKKIAKDYKVSEAEGVVLSTKNKLYVEWRGTFEKTVKERYQRLIGMVQSRKFSIDEYKRMLKPYIDRYRAIKEIGAEAGGRETLRKISWLRPGAQAASYDFATIWSFKEMTPSEPGKPSFEALRGDENILKLPFCPSFKAAIKKNVQYLKDNELTVLPLSPTGIEPLDKWVWALYKYIEKRYDIRFSLAELLKHRNDFVRDPAWGGKPEPYFRCFDADVMRIIIRLPDGTELEDMTFNPMYFFLDSQNMMFLRFLELRAQEKALEKYIDEMLGDATKGKKLEEMSAEYEKLFHVYPTKLPSEKKEETIDANRLREYRERVQKQVEREVSEMKRPIKFIKKGDYEPRFDDRITGPWFETIANSMGLPIQQFLKAKFDVAGFEMPGVK